MAITFEPQNLQITIRDRYDISDCELISQNGFLQEIWIQAKTLDLGIEGFEPRHQSPIIKLPLGGIHRHKITFVPRPVASAEQRPQSGFYEGSMEVWVWGFDPTDQFLDFPNKKQKIEVAAEIFQNSALPFKIYYSIS